MSNFTFLRTLAGPIRQHPTHKPLSSFQSSFSFTFSLSLFLFYFFTSKKVYFLLSIFNWVWLGIQNQNELNLKHLALEPWLSQNWIAG